MFKGRIPEKLEEFIREEAKKRGYQLVDLSTRGGRTFFMEVVLDKEGGITLDECSEFNRHVASWIDEEGIFEYEYTLDVCSPGLDRELKSEGDYSWAVGKDIEVRTHEPVNEANLTVGKLLEVKGREGILMERPDGQTVFVEKKNIAKAKRWVSIK